MLRISVSEMIESSKASAELKEPSEIDAVTGVYTKLGSTLSTLKNDDIGSSKSQALISQLLDHVYELTSKVKTTWPAKNIGHVTQLAIECTNLMGCPSALLRLLEQAISRNFLEEVSVDRILSSCNLE